ncbi:hypothetical protein CALVIDRAFT_568910 [Calocera viscosa TUFC12733]|uniref:Uncharacterized protein n=1 Tax=Calocera viscosa (strain TUFC12733) TaxID=1330018 RepID=A0A167GHQ1_CALVF|nr:hypothetical protein CALVIDRAFT_568910 [Calocera viscosa TUFC12733]
MLASTPTPSERPTTRVDKYVNSLQAAMRLGAARSLASSLSSSAPKPSALKTEQDTRSRADAQAVNWTSLKPKIHDVIDLCDDHDDEGDLIIVTPAVPPQRTPPKMATAVVHHSEYTPSLKVYLTLLKTSPVLPVLGRMPPKVATPEAHHSADNRHGA